MGLILNLVLGLFTFAPSCELVASTMNWEIMECTNYYKSCVKTDTGFQCQLYFDESKLDLNNCRQVAVSNNVAYSECGKYECLSLATLNGMFISCCDDTECTSVIKENS